jgi:hypothetical protein
LTPRSEVWRFGCNTWEKKNLKKEKKVKKLTSQFDFDLLRLHDEDRSPLHQVSGIPVLDVDEGEHASGDICT